MEWYERYMDDTLETQEPRNIMVARVIEYRSMSHITEVDSELRVQADYNAIVCRYKLLVKAMTKESGLSKVRAE